MRTPLVPSLLALVLSAASVATAAPANDNLADAIALDTTTSIVRVQGTVVGATVDPEQLTFPSSWFSDEPSVWYKWESPIGGSMTVQAGGAGFWILPKTFYGSLDNLPLALAGEPSVITLYNSSYGEANYSYDVVAGQTYYTCVQDDGATVASAYTGRFSLIQLFIQDALSDAFATRTPVAGSKFAVTGNNAAATAETDEPKHTASNGIISSGKSVWMTWTPTERRDVTLTATSYAFTPLVAVYTGDTLASLQRVAQSTSSFTKGSTGTAYSGSAHFVAEIGVTYQIAVDGVSGRAGSFTFNLSSKLAAPTFLLQPKSAIVYAGDPAVFSTTVAATGTPTLHWQSYNSATKTWSDLSDDAFFSGTDTATLTINQATDDLNGTRYRLSATDSVGTSYSTIVTVTTTEFPVTETQVLGSVSLDITATTLVDTLDGVTFYAKGLPKGLVLDPVTGVISGAVTAKPGTYSVTYGVMVDGKRLPQTRILLIVVSPFVSSLTGAFEALVYDSNNYPIGKLSLLVSSTGSYTGSYFSLAAGRAASLKGILSRDVDGGTAGTPFGTPVAISFGKGAASLSIEFTLFEPFDPTDYGTLTATVYDSLGDYLGSGGDGHAVSRWTTVNPAPWADTYTGVLDNLTPLVALDPNDNPTPLGSGFATASIASTGVLTLRGKLPDSTLFTASLPSALTGQYLAAQKVHSAIGGSLSGPINLDPIVRKDSSNAYASTSSSGSTLYWVKPVATKDVYYPNGFGADPVTVDVTLLPWRSSSLGLTAALGLSDTGATSAMMVNIVAAVLNDSNDALTSRTNGYGLPIDVQISSKGVLTFVDPDTNPTKFSLSVNASTGAYTGSYVLVDTDALNPTAKPVTRTVTFSGVFLQLTAPMQGDVIGSGQALVPPFDSTEIPTSALLDFRAGTIDSFGF